MDSAGQDVEGGTTVPQKKTRGRQRIEIRYITDKVRRQMTFSKRRKGLFKKAVELSQLCGAHVAVVAFSESGKPFAIGDPSVDVVLRAYVPLPGEEGAWLLHDGDDDAGRHAVVDATLREAKKTQASVKAQQARTKAIGEKVMRAKGKFVRALQRLRDNVRRHADKLCSAPPPPLTPLPLQ